MPSLRRALNVVRRGYRRMFQRTQDSEMRQIHAVLQQVAPLKELPKSVLRDLAEAVHQRTYQRDEFIYYENDPGLGFYVVRRGRIRLLSEDESGAVHELRQAAEHEIVGELSLLGDFRRMETAQAQTEVQVLGFFRPDLKTLTKRNPHAGATILAALARNLASHQVEMVRLLSENEGKVKAMRLLESAVLRTNGRPRGTPPLPD